MTDPHGAEERLEAVAAEERVMGLAEYGGAYGRRVDVDPADLHRLLQTLKETREQLAVAERALRILEMCRPVRDKEMSSLRERAEAAERERDEAGQILVDAVGLDPDGRTRRLPEIARVAARVARVAARDAKVLRDFLPWLAAWGDGTKLSVRDIERHLKLRIAEARQERE